MVLSRFWLVIFISSIVFVVFSLFSGNSYTIDYVLNGKKDDRVLISEKYKEQLPVFIKDSIEKAPEQTMVINRYLEFGYYLRLQKQNCENLQRRSEIRWIIANL